MSYTIRMVDGDEESETLLALHAQTELPYPRNDVPHWWLTFFEDHPVGYLGLMASLISPRMAYLIRVGVLPQHRGNSLQLRMMRAASRFARKQGFSEVISDTTLNPPSANNFIRAGYHTFLPHFPWAFPETIYWRKSL